MLDPKNPDYSNTPASPLRPTYDYAPQDPECPPCVTILTPFYNAGQGFEETARSVLRQSLQCWEWLIVNDCSTDEYSLRVLDDYRQRDPRIRVIDCPTNGGPSRARNIGYKAARTPYIAQIDADDLLEPTAIEKWYWYLETHPNVGFVKGFSIGFGAQQYLWTNGFHCNERFLEDNPVQPNSLIRKQVHADAGGYDESNREGLEDWEFWLRCATAGHWGTTIPEYLDWYRRRASHRDRWDNWDEGARMASFRKGLTQRYPQLWKRGFPRIEPRFATPYEDVIVELPCHNILRKDKPRLLMLVPWMTMGGSDKFSLDLLIQMRKRGWEVTIATTRQGDNAWHHEFARHTPDVFIPSNIVPLADHPRFLHYLIRSRQVDVVLLTHSQLGYLLLPYLRSRCPDVTFVDYCHIQEFDWKNGGYPRFSTGYQELLDLSIVSSQHLKQWMVERGGDPARIAVCYTGIDTGVWKPDAAARESVRSDYGIQSTTPIILFAGRLHEQKQPMVLARTLAALHERGLDFHAIVAGDGPDRGRFEDAIRSLGVARRIKMLGAVSTDNMKRLMPAADIFFLPSKWEGIALSVYEALACGVPVVGAAVGGQRELVDGQCGYLIERSSEDVEIEQYTRILANLLADAERRTAIGESARERVHGYSLDAMGGAMVELFDRARNLAASCPRCPVGAGLGRECAVQGIEYARLEAVADDLWAARENGQSAQPRVPSSSQPAGAKWLRPIRRLLSRRRKPRP